MQRRLCAAVVVGVSLLAAACGGGGSTTKSSNPTTNVTNAVDSSAKDGGTITLSLYGAAKDFDAIAGSSSPKNDALLDKLIPDSSIAIGFQGTGSSSGDADVDAKIGGEDKAVDLLLTGGTLYVRIDLKGIGSSTGVDTSKLTSEGSAVASELPFVGDLLAGKYISLNIKQAGALLKQLMGSTGASGASGSSGSGGSVAQQLVGALRTALTTNTTITQVGSDSVGDHYQVVAMPQAVARTFYATALSIAGPLSSQVGKVQADFSKIPNTPVTVDVWVSGGKVAQVELDLRQFDKGSGAPTSPVGLKAVFSSSAPSFSAPSGATAVDLTKLGSLLGGLLGGSATGASGA